MAKGKKSQSPLMSSAGIMRYYEVEDSAIKVSPKSIIILGLVVTVIVIALNAYYGLWP
jgi:preprotein translocase subunit Sec61beta